MPNPPTFQDALDRLLDVFAFYHRRPAIAASSLELEDCTRDVAQAALATRMPFAALCAELGRAAAESLAHDPIAAVGVERQMTRWAAHVYERRAAS